MKYQLIALRNAIIGWYNDSLEEYKGLDDDAFMYHVCKETGMSSHDYKDVMFGIKPKFSYSTCIALAEDGTFDDSENGRYGYRVFYTVPKEIVEKYFANNGISLSRD